jgi:orotate phosphoribosyltransferase
MVEFTLETAAVGIVALGAINLATRACLHLYKTFVRPSKNLKKYGKWAVITGATGA